MSNQAPQVPAAPAPQRNPTPQQVSEDSLLRLATVDIPAERRRLKSITDPSAQQVLTELAGTQMDITEEIARNQVELRDWAYNFLNALSEHVEALEDRLDNVETYGSETTITPEDAEVLARAVVGAKWVAIALLRGPFPIEERDEDGKQKLAEVIAYAEQAEKIIADSTLSPDSDDDEDEDDGEDDEEDNGAGPS